MAHVLRTVLDRYVAGSPQEAADLGRMHELAGNSRPVEPSRAAALHRLGLRRAPAHRRVLLRWHARQAAWLQVGGHADPGERDPLAVARREAWEETALVDLVPWPDERLLHAVIVPVPAGATEPAHEHADLRYVLATAEPDAARPEQPSGRLRWLSVADAMDLTTEANVRESLARIGRRPDRLPARLGRPGGPGTGRSAPLRPTCGSRYLPLSSPRPKDPTRGPPRW